jgi:hypothetical protein
LASQRVVSFPSAVEFTRQSKVPAGEDNPFNVCASIIADVMTNPFAVVGVMVIVERAPPAVCMSDAEAVTSSGLERFSPTTSYRFSVAWNGDPV